MLTTITATSTYPIQQPVAYKNTKNHKYPPEQYPAKQYQQQ
jgi:hypothetical protein